MHVPAIPLLLGLTGLLPFLWATLLGLGLGDRAAPVLPTVLTGEGRLIMLRYGAIILPFMSGVLWGFATKASGAKAMAAYGLSVIPALWWFFMPGGGVTSSLINLATGFACLLILDFAYQSWGLAPLWLLRLRVLLTLVVLACLAVGIFR